ncbi:putative ribonuclease H-like domain-containing protein [Tanacetum coccineum]
MQPLVTKNVDGKEPIIPPTRVEPRRLIEGTQESRQQNKAEEGPTNFTLMAYTSSSSSSLDTESQLNVGAYKAGLESVEARLDVYKKNEAVVEEDIKILKLDIMLRDNALTELRKIFEKAKKERDDFKLNLEKFENSSKNLSKLQMNDKYKSGEGYHSVPPPYTRNSMPLKPDLVFANKDEYVFSESVTSVPAIATSEVKTIKLKPKSISEPLIEDWIFDSENENEIEFKSRQRKPSNTKVKFVKSNEHVKSPRDSVKKVENYKQAEYPRKNCQSPRGNKRNWNNLMTQKLGSYFEFQNKACYVCGSFNHLIKDCDYYEKKMVEKPVWNNARRGNPHQDFKDKGVIDSGCSRHMTGNKSYLTNYEEIDGGFVAFGGHSKGGKVTGKVPRKDNMYSVDLKNVVPQGGLTCLFAKATLEESNLWHRRLGHVNFKTMNKLVRGNLVRGLPSKLFEIYQTCFACQKGKQHRASCKTKIVSSISQPLQMLHMDLFGPTFVKSLMKKMYCLVVTDDFTRFSWVFFLATKDKTSEILKTFITGIENLIDLRVKVIRSDNGTEFKNRVMNQFCEIKGIKREFSIARTPQQNRVAERKNMTLIEAARTMLADLKLPTTFWAEVVNIACYVQNRVLVIKPHNKTPYELFLGRKPALSFMRPFGCPVTILNTIDHLGKFDGKADEGFFVGYSTNSKAFRVFNSKTRIVEENMHVKFSEDTPSTKACDDAGKTRMETVPVQRFIDVGFKPLGKDKKTDVEDPGNEDSEVPSTEEPRVNQEKDANVNNTNNINIVSLIVNAAVIQDNFVDENIVFGCADDLNMPELEDIVYSDDDEDVGAEADINNLDAYMPVNFFPTTRIHKDHTVEQIIRDLNSAPQTRRMTKNLEEHGLFSSIQQRTNHKDF